MKSIKNKIEIKFKINDQKYTYKANTTHKLYASDRKDRKFNQYR